MDPDDHEMLLYKRLVLLASPGAGELYHGRVVRVRNSGHFFLCMTAIKPLPEYEVENNAGMTSLMYTTDPQGLLELCQNPARYFGGAQGFFGGTSESLIIILWSPVFGICFTCAEADNLESVFVLDPKESDLWASAIGHLEKVDEAKSALKDWSEENILNNDSADGSGSLVDGRAFSGHHYLTIAKRESIRPYSTESERTADSSGNGKEAQRGGRAAASAQPKRTRAKASKAKVETAKKAMPAPAAAQHRPSTRSSTGSAGRKRPTVATAANSTPTPVRKLHPINSVPVTVANATPTTATSEDAAAAPKWKTQARSTTTIGNPTAASKPTHAPTATPPLEPPPTLPPQPPSMPTPIADPTLPPESCEQVAQPPQHAQSANHPHQQPMQPPHPGQPAQAPYYTPYAPPHLPPPPPHHPQHPYYPAAAYHHHIPQCPIPQPNHLHQYSVVDSIFSSLAARQPLSVLPYLGVGANSMVLPPTPSAYPPDNALNMRCERERVKAQMQCHDLEQRPLLSARVRLESARVRLELARQGL